MHKCLQCYTKAIIIPQRYIMVFMALFAVLNAYIMRQWLAITITQLVLPRNHSAEDIAKKAVCKVEEGFDKKANTGTRDWSQKLPSFILGSFYIGYVVTHIPGGMLADKFGVKWVLGLGILSTSVLTLLTPLSIQYGEQYGLILTRIAMGLGEGPTFPALSVLMADWVPPGERGLLGALAFSASQIGIVLSNLITGWLLVGFKWPVVFYVWGFVGILWFLFWTLFCYSSPQTHPCIREKEKQKLSDEIGNMSSKRRDLPPAPMGAICSSIPMWSLIIAQIGHNWAYYTIISYLPKYMNDVLQMRILKNCVMSTLPSLIQWTVSIISGVVADVLIRSNIMKMRHVRNLMTGVAAFGPAIFLIVASYAGCDQVAVISCFCVCMGLMGTYFSGMVLTPIDMSPNYAGTLMALMNGSGAIMGAIAPITVGLMTPNTTIKEFRLVFWVAFVILFVTGAIYCLFSRSELQPWNEPEPSKNKEKD